MSETLTWTENNPPSTRSSIVIMEYTSNTGRVCTHSAFYPERAQNTFLNLWKDHFKQIILYEAFLSRCSSPTCHLGLKEKMIFASWNCHWQREGRPVRSSTAERQALASGLPRMKWELPQSKSASHPFYCPLRRKKTKQKPTSINKQNVQQTRKRYFSHCLSCQEHPGFRPGIKVTWRHQ